MPYAIAPRLIIDGQRRLVPMVVEESSIVAGLGRVGAWIEQQGALTTELCSWRAGACALS